MISRVALALALGLALATLAIVAEPEAPAPTAPPRKTDLVESAETRLVQLDVTARGPASEIASLTRQDFELVVNGEWLESFTVDRLCEDPAAAAVAAEARVVDSGAAAVAAPVVTPRATRPPATYLIYFDQYHLTVAGRQTAIDESRRMIPKLVADGSRIAIASSGDVVEVLLDFTADPQALSSTLDRLEGDRRYWDEYPALEESRIRELREVENRLGHVYACTKAMWFQQMDLYRTEKALRRFSMVLGLLADLEPPKAALCFADTLRRDAGAHYFTYVGPCPQYTVGESKTPHAFDAAHALDGVIAAASAHGIRLYTIQAEGLVTGDTQAVPGNSTPIVPGTNLSRVQPFNPNMQRVRQAQDALVGLALETGGRSFLNGVAASKMVSAIQDDLACLYLISFDGARFRLDSPLSIRVETRRPGVELRTRGRLLMPSESERRSTRLLAAFVAPRSVRSDMTVRGTLIPLGFDQGTYRALVQVAAPGSPVPNAAWDLGASLVSGGEIRMDDSGRVIVGQAGVPVVFESEMRFEPGPFELILVAHDTTANQLGTARIDGSWPERGEGAAIGPIAVVQPSAGTVFLRAGAPRIGGSLACADGEPVRTAEPAALLTLVCRGRKRGALRVLRSLDGETSTEFTSLDLDFDDEPCAQIRDVIPARTMTEGRFEYRVRLLDGVEERAARAQVLHAVGAASPRTDGG